MQERVGDGPIDHCSDGHSSEISNSTSANLDRLLQPTDTGNELAFSDLKRIIFSSTGRYGKMEEKKTHPSTSNGEQNSPDERSRHDDTCVVNLRQHFVRQSL